MQLLGAFPPPTLGIKGNEWHNYNFIDIMLSNVLVIALTKIRFDDKIALGVCVEIRMPRNVRVQHKLLYLMNLYSQFQSQISFKLKTSKVNLQVDR